MKARPADVDGFCQVGKVSRMESFYKLYAIALNSGRSLRHTSPVCLDPGTRSDLLKTEICTVPGTCTLENESFGGDVTRGARGFVWAGGAPKCRYHGDPSSTGPTFLL